MFAHSFKDAMSPSEETEQQTYTEDEDTSPPTPQEVLVHDASNHGGDSSEAQVVSDEVSATSRLESTALALDRLLCSSVRGNFYEEGGLRDKHRPEQLRIFYRMRKEIDEVLSEVKTLKTERAQAEKSGLMSNKKLTEVVTAIVEQQLAPQLRDLTIRNERLEEELKDVKARNEKLEQRVKDRDGKENGKLKKYEEQIAGLSRTVKKGADERVKYDNQLQALTKRLESSERMTNETIEGIQQLKESHATLDKRAESTEDEAQTLEAHRKEQAEGITRVTNDLQSTKGAFDSLQAEVGNQKADVDEELGQLKDWLEDDRYKFSDIDSRLRRAEGRHRRLSDFVRGENDACRRDADDFERRLRWLERR